MAASWAPWLLVGAIAWTALESHAQECGMGALNTRVLGGEEAGEGSWPWQASLHISSGTIPSFHTCGGTLLNQQWVLTAAHCILFQQTNAYMVYLGRHTQNGPHPNEVQRSVRQIFIHPNFNVSSFLNNDLALLRLDSPVEFTDYIRPICLAGSESSFNNTSCVVTGWGKLTINATTIANVLQQADIPVVGQGQCKRQYQALNQGIVITQQMICAGNDGVGICQGDSGGPLACKQNSVWIQAGIASFGQLCATGIPDGYTRVSEFQSWIANQVAAGGGPAGVASVGFVTFSSVTSTGSNVHHSTLLYLLLLSPLPALLG